MRLEGCCFFRTHWSALLHVSSSGVIVASYTNVDSPGCPSAANLATAYMKAAPAERLNDLTVVRCSGSWAVAAADVTPLTSTGVPGCGLSTRSIRTGAIVRACSSRGLERARRRFLLSAGGLLLQY